MGPTGWTCASGYSGTIAPQVCTSAGGAYTLQGCEADCTEPSSVTGYNFSSASGSLAKTGFSRNGVTCATGYTGTVTETPCTTGGADYTVSGCIDNTWTCKNPLSGYDVSSASETDLSTGSSFDVTGITCASGYQGTAIATVCSSSDKYVVSGCTTTTPTTTSSLRANTTTTAAPVVALAKTDASSNITPNMLSIVVAFIALYIMHN